MNRLKKHGQDGFELNCKCPELKQGTNQNISEPFESVFNTHPSPNRPSSPEILDRTQVGFESPELGPKQAQLGRTSQHLVAKIGARGQSPKTRNWKSTSPNIQAFKNMPHALIFLFNNPLELPSVNLSYDRTCQLKKLLQIRSSGFSRMCTYGHSQQISKTSKLCNNSLSQFLVVSFLDWFLYLFYSVRKRILWDKDYVHNDKRLVSEGQLMGSLSHNEESSSLFPFIFFTFQQRTM